MRWILTYPFLVSKQLNPIEGCTLGSVLCSYYYCSLRFLLTVRTPPSCTAYTDGFLFHPFEACTAYTDGFLFHSFEALYFSSGRNLSLGNTVHFLIRATPNSSIQVEDLETKGTVSKYNNPLFLFLKGFILRLPYTTLH